MGRQKEGPQEGNFTIKSWGSLRDALRAVEDKMKALRIENESKTKELEFHLQSKTTSGEGIEITYSWTKNDTYKNQRLCA